MIDRVTSLDAWQRLKLYVLKQSQSGYLFPLGDFLRYQISYRRPTVARHR